MLVTDVAKTIPAQCLGELTICPKGRFPKDGVFVESTHFTVEACPTPHVSRTDGGHLIIKPKREVVDRWELPPDAAIELTVLTEIVGRAMKVALNEVGIPVERINFQDNGNWAIGTTKGPRFHLHLYCRASNSVNQKRGEALLFADKATEFWKKLEMLTIDDVTVIARHIATISREERYALQHWGIRKA